MKRLTLNGINDLYQTPYGAYTLDDYQQLVASRSAVVVKIEKARPATPNSMEIELRNELCIEQHGCSSFLD